jgi:hypothetical protein
MSDGGRGCASTAMIPTPVLMRNPRSADGAGIVLARTRSTTATAWEIFLAPVQVQILVGCGRASQFDPATDKIYK